MVLCKKIKIENNNAGNNISNLINILNISNKETILEIKKSIEGSRLNFLFGAGFSASLLKPLGNLEKYITTLDQSSIPDYKHIISYIYWYFFKKSILPLGKLNKITPEYLNFFLSLKNIINRRGNPIETKQINIFTTNYDTIIELSLENLEIFYNDGFQGKILPKFKTSNFGSITYKSALYSNNKTEIETINLYKLHGSITWKNLVENEIIFNQGYRDDIIKIEENYREVFNEKICKDIIEVIEKNQLEKLDICLIEKKEKSLQLIEDLRKLQIVLPNKEKFKDTVFNLNYHELLRILSNELEKPQSTLFVFGFSFNDEHIREIVLRALVNPSLIIYIFCFNKNEVENFKNKFLNIPNINNIKFIIDDSNINLEKFTSLFERVYKNG